MLFKKSKTKTIAKRTPRRLRAETLESRRVLAASVDLTPEGHLIIQGDAENNRIWVGQEASSDQLRVSIDGQQRDFAVSEVKSILINGLEGNDAIGIGPNVKIPAQIYGGDGADNLQGGGGPTIINGGGGNDLIRGGRMTNILFGGSGNDRIFGGPGTDYIVGGSGDDALYGGAGDDFIFGDGPNVLPEGVTDVLAYARQFADSNTGNDLIFGDAGNDELFGGNGFDEIRGGAGDDLLVGGAGDDLLVGGAGKDTMRGGIGADRIDAKDGEVDIVFADASDKLTFDRTDRIIRAPQTETPVEVDERERLNSLEGELRLF